MIVILAIDALEYTLVEELNCNNLKQKFYGKTDIKEFSEPKTMVLWSSFMTGRNMEKEIVAKGDREMWNTKIDLKDTFFKSFKNPKIIDLPGFSYFIEQHEQERKLLKEYFDAQNEEDKKNIKTAYNNLAFEHHRKIKQEFSAALQGDYDFLLGYFSVADVIGHLNFGNRTVMKILYRDLDEIASTIEDTYIVLSDHGMERIGMFGDHSNYGFWSTDFENLGNPRITDFAGIIKEMTEEKAAEQGDWGGAVAGMVGRSNPKLRKIIPMNNQFQDFEIDHEFPIIGRRIMLLNARRIYREDIGTQAILLAIEDITAQTS